MEKKFSERFEIKNKMLFWLTAGTLYFFVLTGMGLLKVLMSCLKPKNEKEKEEMEQILKEMEVVKKEIPCLKEAIDKKDETALMKAMEKLDNLDLENI